MFRPTFFLVSLLLALTWGASDLPAATPQRLGPNRFARILQSSDASGSNGASKALDGSLTTFSLTQDLPGSFWVATLERAFLFKSIDIVNRSAPNDVELAGLTLRLFNLDDQVVFETSLTNPGSNGTLTIPLPADLWARSIWIGLDGDQKNGGGSARVGLVEVNVLAEVTIPFFPDTTSAPPPAFKVAQSSDYDASFPAANAVDGDAATFTHTGDFANSYWVVDLGAVYPVDRVELVNRQDCCAERLGGLVAKVFDGASNVVAGAVRKVTNPGLGGVWSFTLPSATSGRYLWVGLENGQRNGGGNFYVTLAEARVFSGGRNLLAVGNSPVPITPNLASRKKSYMVRLTPDLRPAANANDDNYATDARTTTATVDGYWEVDLGATYAVYGVRTIAASGIGRRMTNAVARFYDEKHDSVFSRFLSGTPDVFDTDAAGPVFARYVRIGLENKRRTDPSGNLEWYIGMREVEVFGRPTNEVGVLTFAAASPLVNPGEGTVLNWSVEGAQRIELHPDIGSVGGSTGTNGVGQLKVTPAHSTEYWLIATNATEVFTRAVGVEVPGEPLGLRISEVVADNRFSLEDGYGNSPDWIELRNTSDRPVEMRGYGLTDDPSRPLKWSFPNRTVAPHETLIVFASGQKAAVDPAGFLHASFRLGKGGGSVVLTAPDGVTRVDALLGYPALDTDLAYGRDLDGRWTFLEPTPGRLNVAPRYEGWLLPVVFSEERGFFQTAFTLGLTHNNPGATLYYSLDGSVPSIVYSTGLSISGTKAVRAQVRRPGYRPARIQNQTYVFLDEVIGSSVMNKAITRDARYAPRMKSAMTNLPAISIIVPGQPGYEEKEGSVEILWPDGTPASQANCGVERFGGSYQEFAKKSFRVSCRSQYGAKRIEAPLFDGFAHGVTPVKAFDELEFRSGSQDMVDRGFYMAGPFVQDTMMDMGNLNPHGRFVHLYLNGVYWGQYDAREPLVEKMLANYLGGSAADYVKVRGNDNVGDNFVVGTPSPPQVFSWEAALANKGSYQKVRAYVDLQSLIDFMIVWNYGACESEYRSCGPIAAGSGFKFWDADADGFLRTDALGLNRSDNPGPGGIFGALAVEGHPDFKMLVADRIYAALFNDGALTAARADARLTARMNEIQDSLIAECARWGYRTPANWVAAANAIRTRLFPARAAQVVSQFRSRGLYPTVNPPTFDPYGGPVTAGFRPTLTVPAGVVYYTLDGSDPRQPGGGVSPNALSWSPNALEITAETFVSARVRLASGQWSALAKPHYTLAPPPPNRPPVWTGQGDIKVPLNELYELPLTVTDPDLPAQPLRFEATGLPAGYQLELNPLRLRGIASKSGDYAVTLTASDEQDPPLSATLQFVIHVAQPFTASVVLRNTGVQISFPTVEAGTYRLEYTENLSGGVWNLLQEFTAASGDQASVVDPSASGATTRFYRIRWMR